MLISVRLYIQGVDLDPFQITATLGVQPTRAHRKGDTRTLPDGRIVTERMGLWVWKTGANAMTARIDECIETFLETFKSSNSKLRALPNADSIWIDIHIVEDLKDGRTDGDVAFNLTSKQTLALGEFGLPLEFTVSIGAFDA